MDNVQDQKYSLKSLQSLKSLCKMLRNNADQILAAEMSVTIAASTLHELNKAIDNLQDGLSPSSLALDVVANNNDNRNHGNKTRRSSSLVASCLEEWNFHLQLVWDIVSKAPVLVLYDPDAHKVTTATVSSPSSASSSSQSLRLGYFTSLSHLEISSVPIRSIQDLLKMRERLRTLVVVNCFASNFHLQDVLEMCDQEVSVPMQWAVLKHLCVRNNGLHHLDGSLRLCPRLELLDLSKNSLATTDGYLGYLMELTHLDLSHNRLAGLPCVSATTKKKLKILRLAGNRISSLSGVDEMTSLQELDVSENLMATHRCLNPLKGLHRLDRLNMQGCPATMKKDHRVLALQYISTVSLSRKFCLDGHHVTHKEIQNSRAIYIHSFEAAPRQRQHSRPRQGGDNLPQLAQGEDTQQASSAAEDVTVAVTAVRKKKGRKKSKARNMYIADMDVSGGDLSSEVTPSTTPKPASRIEALAELRRQEVLETRAELENYRRHYGENWLQAVDEQGLLPRSSSAINTTTLVSTPTTAAATSVSLSSRMLHKSGTDVAIVKSVTVDVHSDESGSKSRSSRTMDVVGSERYTNSEIAQNADAKQGTSSNSTEDFGEKMSDKEDPFVSAQNLGEKIFDKDNLFLSAQDLTEKVFNKEDLFLSSGSGAEDEMLQQAVKTLYTTGSDGAKKVTNGTSQNDSGVVEREENSVVKGKTSDSLLHYTTQDNMVEPEDQSEPFIVSLPQQPEDPFMITVSPRYLVEKDICGVIKNKLDLQSLKAVRTQMEESLYKAERSADGGLNLDSNPTEVKVFLDFTSVRKDRQGRVYVMEDLISAQHLCELVQPFVDAKLDAARKAMEVMYQCLKCSSQFLRGEATSTVYRESIPYSGSIQDFASMADIGGQKVRLQCPKCGSDHIVLLEDDIPAPPPPTPVSSLISSSIPLESPLSKLLLRKQSMDQIGLQSPKAHSTPLREGVKGSSSQDQQLARSQVDLKGSRSIASRSLLSNETGDTQRIGGEKDPEQDKERSLPFRRRSNAFYDQPAWVEGRRRSDAVVSLSEYQERQTSCSISNQSQDAAGRRASNSVASADDVSQIEQVSILASSDLASSARSSEWVSARAVASSVESDITILNKRDSVASMAVLSWKTAASDILQTDSGLTYTTPRITSRTDSSDIVLISGGLDPEAETRNVLGRNSLSLVHQEEENEEVVTPIGSPLSQSICSSMVSSVYNNSLQPVASASDAYVTANDFSSTALDKEEEGTTLLENEGQDEMSIYDQARSATPVSMSSHKPSVSSEVEVLLMEEEDLGQKTQDNIDNGDGNLFPNGEENTSATFLTTSSNYDNNDGSTEVDEDNSTDVYNAGDSLCLSAEDEAKYDLKQLDHQLALYLMMSVFENDESFKFKVKTCVCQYMMLEEYEALVAVTNMKLYILRINTQDPSVELSEALTLMEVQPHAELRRLDVGLGHMTLRLEYISDCSCYTLVMRDSIMVDTFTERLSGHLQHYSQETGMPVSLVVSEGADQSTLESLSVDVLNRGGNSHHPLRLYILGYMARGHNPLYPVAFVVSSSELCLVKTNHQWPSPYHQTKVTVDSVGKQFTVLERCSINTIATLVVNQTNGCQLCVSFFNESSGDETRWMITMESRKGVRDFIDAIKEPWELEFGVPFDVESSPLDFSLL